MTRDSLKGSNDRREEIVILSSDEEDREYQRKRTNDKLKALASNSIDVSGTSPSSKTRHRRSRSPRIIDHRPSKGSSRHSRERSRDKSRDRYRDKSRDRHRGRSRDRSKEERKNRTRERSRSRHKSRDRRRSRDSSRDRFTSRDRDRRSRDRFERSRSRNRSRRRTPIRSRRSHSRDRIRKSPSPYLGAGPKLGDLLFQMDTLAGSVDRSESPEAKVEVKENGNRRSRSRSHSKSKHLSRHSRSSPNRKNKRSSRSRSGTPKRKHESSTKKKKHKKEKESDHKEHLSDKKKKHRKKKKSEKRSESRADSPSLETSSSPKSTKSQLETSSQKHPPKQSRSEREAKSTPDARSATPESAPSPPPTPHSAPSAEVSDVGSSSPFRQTNVADLSHEPVSQTASSLEDLERDNAAFAEDDLEQQALQVIALLKNEVADPELAPPAQPPKSVAQKPLVIDWLVQRLHNQSNDGKTPPKESTSPQPLIVENSATVGDESESLVSAQELTNQQVNLDKLVGQERVAEEVKIVLKPFYCKGTITKEEYKLIMRNCVTKIYQRSQGRVNPTRVKDYVEKYVGTVIARRK